MFRRAPTSPALTRRPDVLRPAHGRAHALCLALTVGMGLTQTACLTDLLPKDSTPPTTITAGPGTPDIGAVPEWALANPDRDATNEIGIGVGRTLNEATRYALQDVASRLSISVASQLRDVYRESAGESSQSLEQVIETRVRATRFTGWERTRSAQAGEDFWVEVKIDRKRLIRDTRSELDELAEKIDEQFEAARGSELQQTLVLQATEEDRRRVTNLSIVVDAVDPAFDRAKWDERRSKWRVQGNTAKRLLIFEVRADPASRDVARWIHKQLARDQLRARDGSCASDDAVCLDVTTEVVETEVAMRYVAEVRSAVALRDPAGTLIRQEDFVGRGDSSADPARARRRAYDDLRKVLDVSVVLEGLSDTP